MVQRLFAVPATFLALAAPAAAQSVAITGGMVVIGDGSPPIPNGTVVVRDGRVVSAGASPAPAGMPKIDATNKWVTPGIVAGFTRIGITEPVLGLEGTDDRGAPGSPWSAALDIVPAVNPRTPTIAISRAAGITRAVVAPVAASTIFAGQGAVIDLGSDMDAVTRPRAFQFVEFGEKGARQAGGSRAATFVLFTESLRDAQRYAANPAGYQGDDREAVLKRADTRALVAVVTGAVPLLVHVDRSSDILNVLELKKDFPALKLVLVGAAEGWTVASRISAAAVPVIASAMTDLPVRFEQMAATQSNVGRMKAAGVRVSIGMIDGYDVPYELRWSMQFAGNLVALGKVPGATGLSWNEAFATISSGPAEALGMGAEIGSLRAGRRGDVVIWSGDPLELSSAVERVWIDGVEQSLETRQTKLRDRYRRPGRGTLPKAYEFNPKPDVP